MSTQAITKKEMEGILSPENWELTSPKERLFTSNHVLDAYFAGQQNALEQNDKLVMEKLVTNVNKSGTNTSEILAFVKSVKFNPLGVYLKINSWDDFTILLLLPEEEFLSEAIFGVYDFITSFEDSVRSDFYNLSITIFDTNGDFNEDCIKSDGYNYKYKA